MLEEILYWHWIVLGFLLLALEMLAPGAIFMWFGASALFVGGLVYFLPDITWQWQVFIFAATALVDIIIWKKLRKDNKEDDTESGTLNQRGKALVGRRVPLKEAIINGVGRVQIDDTFWRVEGSDLNEGELVVVTSTDGATLKVDKSE